MEVDARLAKTQYDLSVAENGLATQHEQPESTSRAGSRYSLSGRFHHEEDTTTLSLEEARQQASQSRPEIRQAHLKEKQADYDRRIAKAEYIPDLRSRGQLHGSSECAGPSDECRVAGFALTWEPFDWGRRRNRVREKSNTLAQAHNGCTRDRIADRG